MLLALRLQICITGARGGCEWDDRRARLLGHVRLL